MNFKGGVLEEKPAEHTANNDTHKRQHKNIDDVVIYKPNKTVHIDPKPPIKPNIDLGDQTSSNKTPWNEYFYYIAIVCLFLILVVLCLIRSVLRKEVSNMQQAHNIIGQALIEGPLSSSTNPVESSDTSTSGYLDSFTS